MPTDKKTELQRLEILRLSNAESNQITKTCIESALIILMKDQSFHDISITDIVKRAGVSRTAYYRNYKSKEDILKSMMQEVLNMFMEEFKTNPPLKNTTESWHRLFHMLKQHADFIQLLLNANLGDLMLEEIQKTLLLYEQGTLVWKSYKSYFWIGAIYNVSAAWIRDGMQQTDEEMANTCYHIIDSINRECTTVDPI